MLSIEEKDYDLSLLLNFNMLKEILMKLLKNQNDLQNEIDLLKNSNNERDNKIFNIEQLITELQEEESIKDDNEIEPKNEKEEKNEENKQKIIEENNISNLKININDNSNIKPHENNDQVQEGKNEKEIIKEQNQSEKKEENKEEVKKEKEISIKKEESEIIASDRTSNKSKNDLMENIKVISTPKKRHSLQRRSIGKFQNQIPLNNKEIISKINLLEIKLNNIYTNKDLKNIKQELKNHDLENQSDFKMIDKKFSDLNEKLEDFDKKLEDCILKCASIDILNIIKDSGDGTVDGAKILFKSLEDKCNKKFEIIDARYKQEVTITEKMKKNVENIIPVFDKINRDIKQLKELEEQQKEELEITKKNFETEKEKENNNKLQKDLSQDESLKKINELENNFNKKIEDIENKIQSIKKVEQEPLFNLNLNDNENNKVDEEKFQMLEKKVNDIRTKLNDLNNTLTIFSNEEIQKIKNDVKELMYKNDTKIAKEDLKELYNLHLSDVDEINDLKDQMGLILDEQKKTSKDCTQLISKVENLNSNVILLQNSQLNGGKGPIIDISRYVDQQKFTDTLKPIIKEIEKIYKDLSTAKREFNQVLDYEKIFEKKDRVKKLEEEINNKITDLENLSIKKFADKIDTNRALKTLNIQIKDIIEERKKPEGNETWLMAKQPLKCFNCASCEANISNAPSKEYIPWNRYPPSEKIYRMGQGFSHMLQMMTNDFVQTFEHHHDRDRESKENINLSIENDTSSNNKSSNKIFNNINNANNTSNNIYNTNEKSLIASRMHNKDEFLRTNAKMRLPKLKKFSKFVKEKFNETIPVSDEEKDNYGNIIERGLINSESPKIMKIVKKKTKNNFNVGAMTSKHGFSIDYGGNKERKDIFELNLKDKILKKNQNY